jgi:hypothetical protein
MENEMFDSWHSYPSVFALGHRMIKDLFCEDVLLEEKVDGSQFSFGVFVLDGMPELRCRSKGCQLNVELPEKMFQNAVDTAKELFPVLKTGWTYRAEYLQKPKHNALAYERIPNKHLIVFDINTGEEEYMSYEQKAEECKRIGLECVPKIFEGKISEPNIILDFLNNISILGGQKIEGVVIKNYKRFGQDKKALMGKYVSEAYKEVHSAEWRNANPTGGDIIQQIILHYKTPARWNKAIQHLREKGLLESSPRDIGLLMKECQQDLEKECLDDFKEILLKWAKPHILRGCVAGLPEWYKKELLKQHFTVEVK